MFEKFLQAPEFVFWFLVILTVVVFVHELGHYLIARYNGVKVLVFSIGFGREIVGFTDSHGTRWKIGLLPFGGYVKMYGDEDEASATPADDSKMSEADKALSFHHKRVWQRFAIVAAGPAANLIFAVLVYAVLFMTAGQPTTPPIIGKIQPESAAEAAGLRPGDRIIKVDGKGIERFEEIQQIVRVGLGTTLALTVKRDGAELVVPANPKVTEFTDKLGNVHKLAILGITASANEVSMVRYGPGTAIVQAVRQTWGVVDSTFVALGQMISGVRSSDELGGPLRIAQYSREAAQGGIIHFITFIAVLSINLGMINLFPIPMLDGGHLMFYTLEGLMGRPLTPRAQEYGFRFGLFLVLSLMVFSTWNDLVHLKVWDFFKGLIS
jgi:regulator of sigma E protease